MKGRRLLQGGGEVHQDHDSEPVPPLKEILTKPVVLSVANFVWLAFVDIAFRALQPLFFATPIHLGGLGISPAPIGLCLGIFGLVDGAVQGIFFPKVLRRVGLRRLFLTGLFCFVPMFAMFPVINHFAREWGRSPAVWILVMFQLMMNCLTDMCFGKFSLFDVNLISRFHRRVNPGCAFLSITSSVESPRGLGSVHGIGQTAASLGRALGPTIATSLFAYTLQSGLFGGLGVYVILIAMTLCGMPLAYKLPEKAWE